MRDVALGDNAVFIEKRGQTRWQEIRMIDGTDAG
jgi:hypothetical protein